ncbi:MAG: hypothetical protein ACJAS4_003499 [Bacteriovoracaceae bacterium]
MKNLKFVYLFLVIFLASCLPQEKTTQCKSNEAYNSSKRKCVATLGASSSTVNITNITPAGSYAISTADPSKSHAVTVADPYNNGFQIKWVLTLPNGNTSLLGTGLSITFNHTSFAQGSYILEVQLLNASGTEVFDSRSWTVNVITDTTPTISAITASPFSTTTTSAATNISASGNNPDGINNVNYQWMVNGSPIAGESGSFSSTLEALAFSFDPTSSSSYYTGSNVYTVQLVLTENLSNAIYNSETWIINNTTPNYANVTLGTSTTLLTTTPSTASIITTISDTEISNSGFLYDIDGDTNLDAVDFCVQVDNVNGVDGDGVFVDFLIDGTNIPAATNQVMGAANTSYCLLDYNDYKYTIPPSIVAESHTITAVVYDKYTGSTNKPVYNGYSQVDTFTWTIRVRQQNTPPILEIDSVNTGLGGNISCAGKTTTTYSSCEVTHATSFKVALTVTDDDYNPIDFTSEYAKFRVQFYLNGSLLDGTDDISSSDCYEDFSETNTADRYICDLTLNPYDINGPIDVTGLTYSITAKVTDEDSPYLVSATDSNTVTWLVSKVNDYNSGTGVNQFATTDADHIANPEYSYISTQATPGTAITLSAAAVTESEIIQFHVYVDDEERDSHTIKIERCLDLGCTGVVVPAIATSTTNSTNNTNPRLTTINHQIGEDEVTGTNNDDVTYRVTVTDSDGATAQTSVTVNVNNNNPDPVFNTANFNPTVPSSLIAFTGYPLSIDPGTITDASIIDGEVVLYQWMYSTDAGTNWIPISGATSKVLTWSPGQELDFTNQTGSAVKLKLCLGDEGVDAAGASKTALNGGNTDCKANSLDTTGGVVTAAWDVTVFSNMAQGKSYDDNTFANTSFGEVAVWIDPTSVNPVVKYMAYVNIGREIIIEKIITSSDGTKSGSIEAIEELESITFDASTDINYSVNDVTHLTMAGDTVNGALYLSYMAPIAGVDQVHVRRIDISGGKTMLTHDGKFGFDSGYDDLTNNIIISSTGIDPETINTNGLAEINFTDSANNVAMSVNFNGLHGGSTDINAGTQFCNPTTACTTIAATATAFATAINESTATELQGLTATAVGPLVTLEGIAEDDFLQADVGATKIGSIMVNQTTGKWQLPLIDHDLAGGNKNKIALLQGDLNVRLIDSNMAKTSLIGTVPSQEIANDIDANDVVILATRGYSTGEIAVYEMDTSYTLIDINTDIFNDGNIANIKVAVSKETSEFTPSAYITGTNANNRLAFARIDSSGGDYNLAAATTYVDLDSGFSLLFNLDNYDITAGNKENQLLIGAVADSDSNTIYEAYLLQVSGTVPKVTCSYDVADTTSISKCMRLFTQATDPVFNLKVALGDVLEDVTIGSPGATAGENTNDVIPFAFHKDDGGGAIASDALPILGLINVSGTTLTVDETNAGTGYVTPYVAP